MRALFLTVVCALLLAIAGCASSIPYHLTGQPEAYTLSNLHPDEANRRLYTVNYQREGLIPRCTKVQIHEVTGSHMTFSVVETGRTYEYIVHKTLQEPFTDHLDRYFGNDCDPSVVENMSVIDQRGIKEGRAMTGMSKEGVILAIGYPPQHATPSLDTDRWRYWKHRFDTMVVYFENDVVSMIED